MVSTTEIRLVLDWTPNTNHTPFFVGQSQGFYKDENLDIIITDPSSDDYRTTPAARLAAGQVDLAIAPSESVLAYRLSSKKTPLRAIAALLTKDASAIAVLEDGGITRPRDLDGKVYASYGARYEDDIVRAMVRADGGKGELTFVTPPKLGIWDTLLKGEADSTWIFPAWEGVEASHKGVQLTLFKMEDYGIPYGYSPLILENENSRLPEEVVRAFLRATRRAVEWMIANIDSAINIMEDFVPQKDRSLVRQSQQQLHDEQCFGSAGRWGHMEPQKWEDWISWLAVQKLLDTSAVQDQPRVQPQSLYTNEFL